MNTIYKRKPIKGENHNFVTIVMQRKTLTLLLHLVLFRLQSKGGY